MTGVLASVLVASLLGSVHCAGMCGPFLSVAGSTEGTSASRAATQVAYHLGRLVTYASLGAVAGGVGQLLDLAGALAGLARVSALLAGAVMILWGLRALLPQPKLLSLGKGPKRSAVWFGRALALLHRQGPVRRSFVLGLATTLIPCGWLYAFVVTAAGTGGVLSGFAVMGAFWLGTVPMLCGVSFGIRQLSARFGARVKTVSACLIACAGLALIVLRLGAPQLSAGGAGVSTHSDSSAVECPLHRK